MNTVIVSRDFYHRLANRDKNQGDGKHTAQSFRKKYLSELDDAEAWRVETPFIIFDFSGISKIGPSFANEAFAYFTAYASPEKILRRIKFVNTSEVQKAIIDEELVSGYSRK